MPSPPRCLLHLFLLLLSSSVSSRASPWIRLCEPRKPDRSITSTLHARSLCSPAVNRRRYFSLDRREVSAKFRVSPLDSSLRNGVLLDEGDADVKTQLVFRLTLTRDEI